MLKWKKSLYMPAYQVLHRFIQQKGSCSMIQAKNKKYAVMKGMKIVTN